MRWQGSRGREEILGFFWTKSDVCDVVLVTATAVELYARVSQVQFNPVPRLKLCGALGCSPRMPATAHWAS